MLKKNSIIKLVWLSFLLCILASCGGGNTNSSTITPLYSPIDPTKLVKTNVSALPTGCTYQGYGTGPNANGYCNFVSPQDLWKHYNIPLTTSSPILPKNGGAGQTIAIIDASDVYSVTQIVSDLNTFSAKYGLPTCTSTPSVTAGPSVFTCAFSSGGGSFTVVNLNTSSVTKSTGWNTEISLDVQWAHAIATNANIVLVLANNSNGGAGSYASLANAITAAISGCLSVTTGSTTASCSNFPKANIISMSWGGGEFSAEVNGSGNNLACNNTYVICDGFFAQYVKQGLIFVAAAGDSGGAKYYPAASPYVLAVGGTEIVSSVALQTALNQSLAYHDSTFETVWNISGGATGGGLSAYESQPLYQSYFATSNKPYAGYLVQSTTKKYRNIPDVAYNASNGGSAVSMVLNGAWTAVGGTSAGTPQWAALVSQIASVYPTTSFPNFASKIANVANSSGTPYGFGFNSYLYSLASIYIPDPASGASATVGNSPLFDITKGTDSSSKNCSTCSAGVGFDDTTGLGVPVDVEILSNYL